MHRIRTGWLKKNGTIKIYCFNGESGVMFDLRVPSNEMSDVSSKSNRAPRMKKNQLLYP
jgi:hypothetical protein